MPFKRPKISRRKIALFSVFVIIATIFWFLNAMNLEYTTKIEYPVEFYNFPKDVSISSDYPESLTISIKASGFDIIRKTKKSETIKIDVNKFSIQDKSEPTKLTINFKKNANELFSHLHNIEIISILPEIVTLTTSKVFFKKIPVKLNVEFTTHPLYIQSGDIIMNPDSIEISGPKKLLSDIKYIETNLLKLTNVKDSITKDIDFKKLKQISFLENKTSVLIPIDKFTENEILIPVEIINCPDSIRLITFPNTIKITFKIALSRFKTINVQSFKAVVDYEKTKLILNDRIPVELKEFPNHLQTVKIYPEYLEYIIEKTPK